MAFGKEANSHYLVHSNYIYILYFGRFSLCIIELLSLITRDSIVVATQRDSSKVWQQFVVELQELWSLQLCQSQVWIILLWKTKLKTVIPHSPDQTKLLILTLSLHMNICSVFTLTRSMYGITPSKYNDFLTKCTNVCMYHLHKNQRPRIETGCVTACVHWWNRPYQLFNWTAATSGWLIFHSSFQ